MLDINQVGRWNTRTHSYKISNDQGVSSMPEEAIVNRKSLLRPDVISEYVRWLRNVRWQFFATFTFAYRVSELHANGIFDGFIDRIERSVRSPVIYVRGTERRFSGCGMPGNQTHFHLVLASDANISRAWIAAVWEGMAGQRSHGAGADVRAYDARLDGISYVLKFINEGQARLEISEP